MFAVVSLIIPAKHCPQWLPGKPARLVTWRVRLMPRLTGKVLCQSSVRLQKPTQSGVSSSVSPTHFRFLHGWPPLTENPHGFLLHFSTETSSTLLARFVKKKRRFAASHFQSPLQTRSVCCWYGITLRAFYTKPSPLRPQGGVGDKREFCTTFMPQRWSFLSVLEIQTRKCSHACSWGGGADMDSCTVIQNLKLTVLRQLNRPYIILCTL